MSRKYSQLDKEVVFQGIVSYSFKRWAVVTLYLFSFIIYFINFNFDHMGQS